MGLRPSATPEQIEAWKQEILDIRCGWEWAFANGARSEGGKGNPALKEVLDREAHLNALIMEHTK
jgi:hypothetical protein